MNAKWFPVRVGFAVTREVVVGAAMAAIGCHGHASRPWPLPQGRRPGRAKRNPVLLCNRTPGCPGSAVGATRTRVRPRETAFAFAIFLLSGCATLRDQAAAPAPLPESQRAEAEAAQAAREAALQGRTWDMTGRIALSNGRRGGSGRIEWHGDIAGRTYVVSLSAPVTRQSWRLTGDAAGATLEGLEGGPRSGADAVALLREATGWEIPVRALSAWIVGARARGEFGAAQIEFAADRSLTALSQGGWTVRYADWRTGSFAGVDAMPGRIEATRGDARVRLVVDDWTQASPPAQAAR